MEVLECLDLNEATKEGRQPWEAVGMTLGLETFHDVGTCYEIECKMPVTKWVPSC